MWYDDTAQAIGEDDITFGLGRWVVRKVDTPSRRLAAVAALCSDGSGSLYVSFDPVTVCLVCSDYAGKSPPLVLDRAVYAVGTNRNWRSDVDRDAELRDVWALPSSLSPGSAEVAYSWAGDDAHRFVGEILQAAKSEYVRIGMLRGFGSAIDDQSWFTFVRLDGIDEARQAALACTTDAYIIAKAGKSLPI